MGGKQCVGDSGEKKGLLFDVPFEPSIFELCYLEHFIIISNLFYVPSILLYYYYINITIVIVII